MCIYNSIWYMYIENDKYEFNTRSVGPFNNNKHVIYGINENNTTSRDRQIYA